MMAYLNRLKLRQKLYLLFFVGVLLPMFLTDGIIISSIARANRDNIRNLQEKATSEVEHTLQSRLLYPTTIAANIVSSSVVENFLNEKYPSPLKYYDRYYQLRRELLFGQNLGIEDARLYIYADNDTIISGGGFYELSKARETDWYQKYQESPKTQMLTFYYGTISAVDRTPRRKILWMQTMDGISIRGCEKMLMIEMGYSGFARELAALDLDFDVYVCDGHMVVLSNREDSRAQEGYSPIMFDREKAYARETDLYGNKFWIYAVPRQTDFWHYFGKYSGVLTGLIVLNVLLPILMMQLIEKSITVRIEKLQRKFENIEPEELDVIERIEGDDEITSLMQSYNKMALQINELIESVYKGRMREQEINIAKQKAELLALHSQINPHFLFNALESIRMHSLVRNETETADMVGKLALMERTYVSWGEDMIPLQREMDFVDAYLTLQKYRFGDRLNYKFSIPADCRQCTIPKLTIVTFVENACVHGVERKANPGWIFVNAYKEAGWLRLEIEDTGIGIDEEQAEEIRERIRNISVENMNGNKHVGMMNAYLRLHLFSKGHAEFELETEKDVGTTVRIGIPLGVI